MDRRSCRSRGNIGHGLHGTGRNPFRFDGILCLPDEVRISWWSEDRHIDPLYKRSMLRSSMLTTCCRINKGGDRSE